MLNKIGKVAKEWLKTRQKFLKRYLDQGYVSCVYCGKSFVVYLEDGIIKSGIDIDHKKNRSTNPELRNEMSNLQPACRN
jgi:5-methylcytosine-specific restriction endonuclease McrA